MKNDYLYYYTSPLCVHNRWLEAEKTYFIIFHNSDTDWAYRILRINEELGLSFSFNKNIAIYQTDCEDEYLKTIKDCKKKMHKIYYQELDQPDWLVKKEKQGRLAFRFER